MDGAAGDAGRTTGFKYTWKRRWHVAEAADGGHSTQREHYVAEGRLRIPPEPIFTFALARWARLSTVSLWRRRLERGLELRPSWVEVVDLREFSFRGDRKTRCGDDCVGRWWISRGRIEEWREPPEVEREPFVCYASILAVGYCADPSTADLYHVHVVPSNRARVSGWRIGPPESRGAMRWEWRREWTRRVSSRGRGTHLLPAEIEKHTRG